MLHEHTLDQLLSKLSSMPLTDRRAILKVLPSLQRSYVQSRLREIDEVRSEVTMQADLPREQVKECSLDRFDYSNFSKDFASHLSELINENEDTRPLVLLTDRARHALVTALDKIQALPISTTPQDASTKRRKFLSGIVRRNSKAKS